MAEEEVGVMYTEHESAGTEESGPISDDVDDVSHEQKDGYALIDIAILLSLLGKFYMKCKEDVLEVTQKRSGAMITFHILCSKGHQQIVRTQNIISHQPEGSVLLASGILTSGMTFATWKRFCIAMKIPSISHTTQYTLINKYVMPVIFTVWTKMREAGFASIRASGTLATWVADGQFDSAGYCAKYLIEIVMCATTGRIVDFLIFQKGLDKGEMECKDSGFCSTAGRSRT